MYLWGQRSASNLGAYFPRRSPYALRGMGDVTNVPVDTTTLIVAGGLLAVAALLFVGREARGTVRAYRRSRLQVKKARLQKQLSALGSL
jgi:hypothetical protein